MACVQPVPRGVGLCSKWASPEPGVVVAAVQNNQAGARQRACGAAGNSPSAGTRPLLPGPCPPPPPLTAHPFQHCPLSLPPWRWHSVSLPRGLVGTAPCRGVGLGALSGCWRQCEELGWRWACLWPAASGCSLTFPGGLSPKCLPHCPQLLSTHVQSCPQPADRPSWKVPGSQVRVGPTWGWGWLSCPWSKRAGCLGQG